jgi:His-Xaa-Ser system protein HxsD
VIVRVSFDASSHSIDAIQRAAYRFSDRLSHELAAEEGTLTCTLFLVTDDPAVAETVVGEFRNEVLDQVLRERIRRETEEVRNVVLAHAFSNTGLVDAE